MTSTRTHGTGSIFYAASTGLWTGSREVPVLAGQKRKQCRVRSTTFCGMLKKFSALADELGPLAVPLWPIRSRRENLELARAQGQHTRREWDYKRFHQRGICYYCGKKAYRKQELADGREIWVGLLVMDHMVPVARGGSDAVANIVGACESCNQSKATKTADEYFAWLKGRDGQ